MTLPSFDALVAAVIGPGGALVALIVVCAMLWHRLDQAVAANARQAELFESALSLIRDDLVPLVRDAVGRRR